MASQGGKVEGDGIFSSQKIADSACCTKSETSFQIRSPMSRPAYGTDGRVIQLLANHFNVKFTRHDAVFYNYSITIKSNDKIDETIATSKSLGRKILDKLYQTYSSELNGKEFVYDGAKSLFTVGPLPQNNFEFTVVLDNSSSRSASGNPGKGSPIEGDQKRLKHSYLTRTYNVEMKFATMIPLETIAHALKGINSEHTHDALRVLDIILRQQHAKRGCLLIKQSFFDGNHANFVDLGGGVTGCRGIHTSFRTTGAGLSLNIDVSTTLIMSPGPVLNFLLANQNVQNPLQIDWVKAKRMLKNIRIKTEHNKKEFKITGISELPCNQQSFNMKVRNNDGESQMVEITVYDYFRESHNIELTWSAYAPCLDVGKPTQPNYLPVELCHLIPLQCYTKALSSQQRASLVEKSRQKPQERISVVTNILKKNQYDEDPILRACGFYIDKQLTKLDGRVLHAPKLKIGNEEELVPQNGRWNFNRKRLLRPVKIGQKDQYWAIVNFSARCDLSYLSRELLSCARNKGIHMERPYTIIEEDRQWLKLSPVVRVERMFEKMMPHIPEKPKFLLCVLPEKKNSEIYGPWKKKNLVEMGIVTQCISPTKINDQYLTNVLLKINTKLGGINSLLAIEYPSIPLINKDVMMIFGMDVSHGSRHSDLPSVAAVVGSRQWPLVSRYRASVTTQSSKLEMIDSLFKLGADGKDEGMIRELLIDFYNSTNGMKPTQIVIFRDGVGESQFNQVLNVELTQFLKAFEHLGEPTPPKFTLIVAQKNHHTKLFLANGSENVPPGTVVDTMVVHPRNYDFYMCPQAGMIGMSRPVHYNVLLDEIGFSPDDLQKFVHSLSYVYQRSTSAVSMVAPVCYAHLAASQMSQFIKLDAAEEPSSEASAGERMTFPQLPRLHENVRHTMFFC
ncbi:protein argonaute 16-like isoform X1 [Zingiber officinale]|uniref:protein argonaute 16-like isoform X1 n=1 Tax=Zingiber officinale TaxID=94328 RepID=UPI001C4A7F04|nr:protein argonaute 16-like isoform X1 [Zingiber officinale]XP_042377620.1 protein argonaute 16-like isoform X1 [Zingiber officinale]XP_042377621.1 protein argonaute 16-like isoform X1 [Zingiber officinale]